MANLQDAVRKISSEKASDRSAGIEQYRLIFANDETLERLGHGDDGDKRWQRAMQALFNCAFIDRNACMRKGSLADASSVALKRLHESTTLVLWMIERAHRYFGSETVVSSINHLTSMLEYRTGTFEPIAAVYLKALRILLTFQPHVDHLEKSVWFLTASTCFNVIFGTPLSDDVSLEEARQHAEQSDDIQPNTQAHSRPLRKVGPRRSRPEDVEAAASISALLRSDYAPLLDEDQHGATILYRFASILSIFTHETSLHLHTIEALNATLAVMQVNDTDCMLRFADLAWHHLVRLWNSRGQALKEQVHLALRTMSPIVIQAGRRNLLQSLGHVILSEANDRLALQPIALDHVDLCINRQTRPFQYRSIRASDRTSEVEFRTWSVLELGSDILAAIHLPSLTTSQPAENGLDVNGATGSSPSKRRRLATEHPLPDEKEVDQLAGLLKSIKNIRKTSSASDLWNLQLLLFVILRHSDRLSIASINDCLSVLSLNLKHEDTNVVSWSFIALAASVHLPSFATVSQLVWTTACRHFVRRQTCRSATHLGRCVLTAERISKVELAESLSILLSNIQTQNPGAVTDPLCAFLSLALSFADSDVRMAQKDFGGNTIDWLRDCLDSAMQFSTNPHSYHSIFTDVSGFEFANLMLSICKHHERQIPPLKLEVADTVTTRWVRSDFEQSQILNFVLFARVDEQEESSTQRKSSKGLMNSLVLGSNTVRGFRIPTPMESRCVNLISQKMVNANGMMESLTAEDTLSEPQFRSLVELATACLHILSELHDDGVSLDMPSVKEAFKLLQSTLETLSQPRYPALLKASILRLLRCVNEDDLDESGKGSRASLSLQSMWCDDEALPTLMAIQKLFDDAAREANEEGEDLVEDMDGDAWMGDQGDVNGLPDRNRESTSIITAYILLTYRFCALDGVKDARPEIHSRLAEWLANAPTRMFIDTAPTVLDIAADLNLRFGDDIQDLWIDRLGTDILATYDFERQVEGHLLALKFLSLTRESWLGRKDKDCKEQSHAVQILQFLTQQFTKGNLHWRVEIQYARLIRLALSDILDSSYTQQALPKVLRTQHALSSLCSMLGRQNVQTRFELAKHISFLFDVWKEHEGNVNELYRQVKDNLPRTQENRSEMAARMLVFANLSLTDAGIRPFAFYHFVEVFIVSSQSQDLGGAVFASIARQLAFPDRKSMWIAFAEHVFAAWVRNKMDIHQIPYLTLGYSTRLSWARATFPAVAPTLLLDREEGYAAAYKSLCRLAMKTEKSGFYECLPKIAARVLVSSSDDESTPAAGLQHLARDIEALLSSNSPQEASLVKQLEEQMDAVIVECLLIWYDDSISNMSKSIEEQAGPSGAWLDFDTEVDDEIQLLPPLPPFFGSEKLLSGIARSSHRRFQAQSVEVAYSVIYRLGALIFKTHVSHDQNRWIYSLRLYVSFAWSAISFSPVALRALLHVSSVLYKQAALSRAITPILAASLKAIKIDVPGLAAIVVSVASQAHTYATGPDTKTSEIGKVLLEQCENTVLPTLFNSDEMRTMAIDALSAWPRRLPAKIAELIGDIRLGDIERSLKDVKVVNVMLLERCRDALANADSSQIVAFSSSPLWSLIETLKLTDEDTGRTASDISNTFADILYACDGHVRTPSVRNIQRSSNQTDVLAVVRRAETKAKQSVHPLRHWIVFQLLNESRSSNLTDCQDAVTTLRTMISHDSSFLGKTTDWSKSCTEELRLSIVFPLIKIDIQKRQREELDHESALKHTSSIEDWSCWLCSLLCELMTTREPERPYAHLSFYVKDRPRVAKTMLRAIVHLVYRSSLTNSKEAAKDTSALSAHFLKALASDETDERIWEEIIAIILQLREDAKDDTPFSGNRWIEKIDFLLLASRAAEIHLYASTLLFIELHKESRPTVTPREEDIVRNLLYESYSNISEPDSFYGIKNPNVIDALQRKHEHEGQWDRLFELQAARFESLDEHEGMLGISHSLSRQGFNQLARQLGSDKSMDDYELALRTNRWDLPARSSDRMSPSSSLYAALRALHSDHNLRTAEVALDQGFADCFDDVRKMNMEANTEAIRTVNGLLSLREVRLWNKGKMELLANGKGSNLSFEALEKMMTVQVSLLQSNRARLRAQTIGDRLTDSEVSNALIGESIVQLELSKRAREENKTQVAINAVLRARQRMSQLNEKDKMQIVEEEFAQVLWTQGDHSIAIDALSSTLSDDKTPSSLGGKKRRAQSLARLGEWRAIARSHQAQLIVNDCFRPALKLLDGTRSNAEMAEVCYRFAAFADEQYRALCSAHEARELEKVIAHRRDEIRLIQLEIAKPSAVKGSRRSLEEAKRRANTILSLDLSTLKEHESAKDRFRRQAAEMFARDLQLSDKNNHDALMRLTALWFENAHNEAFNHSLCRVMEQIPSWKVVPLARQLCSRLSKDSAQKQGSSSASFQRMIYDLVTRMTYDHPFHTLYSLYALARGNEDDQHSRLRGKAVGRTSSSSIDSTTSTQQRSARADAATAIIDHVASQAARHRERIMQWRFICDACVEWAQVELDRALPKVFGAKGTGGKSGTIVQIPSHLKILKIRDFDVPVITAPLAVDPTGKYASFVSIASYANRFTTAGGVHLPKISECIGSDGKHYRQLFKNRDDLRQDAVMQQVFTLVNDLLDKDRRARQRSLYVRTYSVVPLGPQYGLLEFVGNTAPIYGPWSTLYQRYAKEGRLRPDEARRKLSEVHAKTPEEKRKRFEEVCAQFPPLFRYYFLDRYTVPLALMQARLNYTRSVATTSIVGHILGLGDRHASNILLDQQTGEVIHIDFGVAFDQGKLLPIPELVPFRLTQNMVDGMGLNGVEGVFRCGCQETLRVLRAGANVIKTVLEVFRYDPLYDWTQNPIKVIQAQGYSDDGGADVSVMLGGHRESQDAALRPANGAPVASGVSTNSTSSTVTNGNGNGHGNGNGNGNGNGQVKETAELSAVRAINSVMEKLSNTLSVEYTVNDLMTRAMDHTNLGSIFHGWQAAL